MRPRLGFLGVGWIGRHRMQAIHETGLVEVAAIADTVPQMAADAGLLVPDARLVATLDELLDVGVDAVVIATPSAMHAAQSIQALQHGAAVFCQKPLGRTMAEAAAVVEAARVADRLLAVDFSYRGTEGMRRIRELVRAGALGRVFAVDLVFHNAYGPDKSWFHDRALSGGGCVMDLGVHLIDLALWTLDFPQATDVSARLFAGGRPLDGGDGRVEDYAVATIMLGQDIVVRLACSWHLQAGCDAVISAAFHGTEGGAVMRNVNGSFYEFRAERFRGTACETLASGADEWGGFVAADWARRLAAGEAFAPEAFRLADVAGLVDRIYGGREKGETAGG